MSRVRKLTIEGFKSIRKLEDFELRPLNVLIGANGAGKSNFLGFLELVRELVEQRLQLAVQQQGGGADAYLHLGPKVTKALRSSLDLGGARYQFALAPTADGRFVFVEETLVPAEFDLVHVFGSGHSESRLARDQGSPEVSRTRSAIADWAIYHFDDTGRDAALRRQGAINDNERLRANGGNLAAILYLIEKVDPAAYRRIRDVVRLAAPFFDDFKLRPIPYDPERIQLEWLQQGSDYPFRPSQLSDGTLRFICLATALLQPDPPAMMLFDEPELGLHPYALTLLTELFQTAAANGVQVIVSTQSVPLLNEFAPEDVIVVDRVDGASTFERLSAERLAEWLNEYSLGELWQKNLLGGRPKPEATPQPTTQPGD